jgi:hypothetical protein
MTKKASKKPQKEGGKVRITEARLNDLAYMALKYSFFEPYGYGNPRGADIRIVMDMSVPEERLTLRSAILLPNEKPGASHNIWYEVDPNTVLEVAVTYIEDHWVKQSADEGQKEILRKWWKEVVPTIMEVPEELCGTEV